MDGYMRNVKNNPRFIEVTMNCRARFCVASNAANAALLLLLLLPCCEVARTRRVADVAATAEAATKNQSAKSAITTSARVVCAYTFVINVV